MISSLLVYASSLLRPTRRTDELVLSEQGNAEEDPFGTIRTHIFPEEVIEHEVSRHNSRTDSDEAGDILEEDVRNEIVVQADDSHPLHDGLSENNTENAADRDEVVDILPDNSHELQENHVETEPFTPRNSLSAIDDGESKKDL